MPPNPGFYAVKIGRQPGVYLSWAGCEAQVKGFSDAQYKKFQNATEAETYLADGDPSSSKSKEATSSTIVPASVPPTKGRKRALSTVEDESGWDVVYSDGACKGNGKIGSVAGVGVWWAPDDPRNIAERCPGEQTNNRAELIAILRVLEETPLTNRPLLIKSDSQYSINCFKQWLPNWIKNGWKNQKKEDVKNAGIIRLISAQLDYRASHRQQVRLQYVKGHSGNLGNDGADAEANKGALLPPVPERIWEEAEEEVRKKIDLLEEAPLGVTKASDKSIIPHMSPKRKKLSPQHISTEDAGTKPNGPRSNTASIVQTPPRATRSNTSRLDEIQPALRVPASSVIASSRSGPSSSSAKPSSNKTSALAKPAPVTNPTSITRSNKRISTSPSPSKPTSVNPSKLQSKPTLNSSLLTPPSQRSIQTSTQVQMPAEVNDRVSQKKTTTYSYDASKPLLNTLMPSVGQPCLIAATANDMDFSIFEGCLLDDSELSKELDD